ncbi:Pre-mRNA-splicing factor of RES complex-domain-containing protein [Butyriboletus roseoflavus]|nr:Pre-mRNA-splicing factor of RES complex-domain-containing protein [Butyriboletus roseoflavus]
MQAYLAQKYMSGPKAEAILARTAPKKKRKVASGTTSGPSIFVDDDTGFGDEVSRQQQDDEMDVTEAAVATDRSFKKRRTDARSGWTTVHEGVKREESPSIPPDEQPTVVEDVRPFKGGLIRSEDLRKQSMAHVKQDEMAREEVDAAQETVYRDASGRKIDMKLARAEAARKKREKQEKEAQKMEWGKGLTQREEEQKRRIQLEKNKSLPFSRQADDMELNEELMARDRWNDPAATFLTKQTSKITKKPEYRGPPPPPNRFGIKPGYRWDGVDRGNGFEKKWFQRINDRKRTETASYEWSVDDM